MALWAGAGKHNTCLITTALNMAVTLCLKHAAAKVQHWVVHHAASEQLSSADVAVFGAAEHKKCLVSVMCILCSYAEPRPAVDRTAQHCGYVRAPYSPHA